MTNKTINETPAIKVLKLDQKPVEVLSTPATPKKKRYHKKPKQVVTDVVAQVEVLVEDTKEEVAKLNPLTWFKLQWSNFVLWFKS